MYGNQRKENQKGQKGIVLLLALVALLLISAVGASLLFMATATTTFVGAQRASARAFHSTIGGLEEARYRLLPALLPANGGVNYLDTEGTPAAVFPCSASELPGTMIPCNTFGLTAYGGRPETVLYFVNSAAPAVPSIDPTVSGSDLTVVSEIQGYDTTDAVVISTLQANPGTTEAVPWTWVRVNLKTEVSSGEDIDFDGNIDKETPVFVYLGRQYNYEALNTWDVDGPGAPNPLPPGAVLPFPWGPDPRAQVPPIQDRTCIHLICASPVYTLTAKTVSLAWGTTRIVRMEIATTPSFSINASLFSIPSVTLSGGVQASGRDICDVDCRDAGYTFANDNRYDSGGPVASVFTADQIPPNPGPAANCRSVFPAFTSNSTGGINGNSVVTDPGKAECQALYGADCITNAPSDAGIVANADNPYDINELINMLMPGATTMTTDGIGYYPGNAGSIDCNTIRCRVQGGLLGGFPTDPILGTNADPVTTYVPGNLRCSAGCSGAGILIVDGDLVFTAGFQFYGIIIVRGSVSLGGVANVPCNIYGAILSGGNILTDSTGVSGGICFQYNSCAQRQQFTQTPPYLLSFREIPGR